LDYACLGVNYNGVREPAKRRTLLDLVTASPQIVQSRRRHVGRY
jgi:hypothetical protein